MITFNQKNNQKIEIIKDGKVVGQIFSPSGSGKDKINAIQVCGFTEAFDLWGCGVFKGFKDIQLLFDGKSMGDSIIRDNCLEEGCYRCFQRECKCPLKMLDSHKLKDRMEEK